MASNALQPSQGDNQGETRPPGFDEAVLRPSQPLPEGVHLKVRGYDFNNGLDYDSLFASLGSTGMQATHFNRAVEVINAMIERKKDMPTGHEAKQSLQTVIDIGLEHARRSGCTIFLAYTSNMVSSGVRDVIRFLVQHKLVDVLVTTAGGVEEDFVKCMAPFYVGDFSRWTGEHLRSLGINRTGNLLVPNDNYVKFESWLLPILEKLLIEQRTQGVNWTPSKIIRRLGKEIDNKDSVYYWCYKNDIPVFCPGLTDGALGDVLFAHSYQSPPGLRVDLVEDIRGINRTAIYSYTTGVIVLGGGIVKHHTMNANLMRNGADYAVYVNTAEEYDGSDAGARPDEAVSWGKLKHTSEPVKVHADASLIFPLLVSQTFAKKHHKHHT